ncbi:unnamed protein product [Closterium sp. Naga37s-1]|nr:unnamed protein product [Closterium sp. Naga37s-1]
MTRRQAAAAAGTVDDRKGFAGSSEGSSSCAAVASLGASDGYDFAAADPARRDGGESNQEPPSSWLDRKLLERNDRDDSEVDSLRMCWIWAVISLDGLAVVFARVRARARVCWIWAVMSVGLLAMIFTIVWTQASKEQQAEREGQCGEWAAFIESHFNSTQANTRALAEFVHAYYIDGRESFFRPSKFLKFSSSALHARPVAAFVGYALRVNSSALRSHVERQLQGCLIAVSAEFSCRPPGLPLYVPLLLGTSSNEGSSVRRLPRNRTAAGADLLSDPTLAAMIRVADTGRSNAMSPRLSSPLPITSHPSPLPCPLSPSDPTLAATIRAADIGHNPMLAAMIRAADTGRSGAMSAPMASPASPFHMVAQAFPVYDAHDHGHVFVHVPGAASTTANSTGSSRSGGRSGNNGSSGSGSSSGSGTEGSGSTSNGSSGSIPTNSPDAHAPTGPPPHPHTGIDPSAPQSFEPDSLDALTKPHGFFIAAYSFHTLRLAPNFEQLKSLPLRTYLVDVTNESSPAVLFGPEGTEGMTGKQAGVWAAVAHKRRVVQYQGRVQYPMWFGDPSRNFVLVCEPEANAKPSPPFVWMVVSFIILAISVLVLWMSVHLMAKLETDTLRVESAQAQLATAKVAAEAASRAKSDFLTTMSHEIRTPMNGVIGMLNLLMETPLDGTQQDYAETACSSGRALCALINDILDLSKIEAEKLRLERIPLNLRAELDDVLALFVESAEEKRSVELAAFVADDVPETLVGDPLRIRQILMNLIGNAFKFTSTGHIFLVIRLALPDDTVHSLASSASTSLHHHRQHLHHSQHHQQHHSHHQHHHHHSHSHHQQHHHSHSHHGYHRRRNSDPDRHWRSMLEELSVSFHHHSHHHHSHHHCRHASREEGRSGKAAPGAPEEAVPPAAAAAAAALTLSGRPAVHTWCSWEAMGGTVDLSTVGTGTISTSIGTWTGTGTGTANHSCQQHGMANHTCSSDAQSHPVCAGQAVQGVAESSHVHPACGGQAVRLLVAVEDTGEGIPMAAQRGMFRPYSQAHASTTRLHGGTGIGLSICKRLVSLMGGSIAFTSEPGVGTTFYFDITLHTPPTDTPSTPPPCCPPPFPPSSAHSCPAPCPPPPPPPPLAPSMPLLPRTISPAASGPSFTPAAAAAACSAAAAGAGETVAGSEMGVCVVSGGGGGRAAEGWEGVLVVSVDDRPVRHAVTLSLLRRLGICTLPCPSFHLLPLLLAQHHYGLPPAAAAARESYVASTAAPTGAPAATKTRSQPLEAPQKKTRSQSLIPLLPDSKKTRSQPLLRFAPHHWRHRSSTAALDPPTAHHCTATHPPSLIPSLLALQPPDSSSLPPAPTATSALAPSPSVPPAPTVPTASAAAMPSAAGPSPTAASSSSSSMPPRLASLPCSISASATSAPPSASTTALRAAARASGACPSSSPDLSSNPSRRSKHLPPTSSSLARTSSLSTKKERLHASTSSFPPSLSRTPSLSHNDLPSLRKAFQKQAERAYAEGACSPSLSLHPPSSPALSLDPPSGPLLCTFDRLPEPPLGTQSLPSYPPRVPSLSSPHAPSLSLTPASSSHISNPTGTGSAASKHARASSVSAVGPPRLSALGECAPGRMGCSLHGASNFGCAARDGVVVEGWQSTQSTQSMRRTASSSSETQVVSRFGAPATPAASPSPVTTVPYLLSLGFDAVVRKPLRRNTVAAALLPLFLPRPPESGQLHSPHVSSHGFDADPGRGLEMDSAYISEPLKLRGLQIDYGVCDYMEGDCSEGGSREDGSRGGERREGESKVGGNREGEGNEGESREGAIGEGASREGANGEGASREGANGEGESREGANGEGASREGANGEGASREGANGEGASREGANVVAAQPPPTPTAAPAAAVAAAREQAAVGEGLGVLEPTQEPATVGERLSVLLGQRVMVVDDNLINRKVASKLLERHGARVTAVDGGAKALVALEPPHHYDLVFMDLQMPGMDGLEATRRIRARERAQGGGHVAIIALTADVIAGTRHHCFAVGMDDYLSKPLHDAPLSHAVWRCLANR